MDYYDESINSLLKEVTNSKEKYDNKCPRDEEVNAIERLRNTLHVLEKHIQQLRKEFKQVLEELIINDDAITQRFGGAPTVNILRGSSNSPLRPLTANPRLSLSSSFRGRRKTSK